MNIYKHTFAESFYIPGTYKFFLSLWLNIKELATQWYFTLFSWLIVSMLRMPWDCIAADLYFWALTGTVLRIIINRVLIHWISYFFFLKYCTLTANSLCYILHVSVPAIYSVPSFIWSIMCKQLRDTIFKINTLLCSSSGK